ncbi:hypothetical protein [Halovivax sp.]|uniref:hypothetical protein n=1 Tax=Halovivax sp. TaxID=1935978 RepID=UPI0025C1C00F|nr:hypothetical protein [Halovivax sp.]
MTKLLFVDSSGTFGVINEDLLIESLGDVDEEVRRFVRDVDADSNASASIDALHPEFTFDLYARTSIRELYVHDRPEDR